GGVLGDRTAREGPVEPFHNARDDRLLALDVVEDAEVGPGGVLNLERSDAGPRLQQVQARTELAVRVVLDHQDLRRAPNARQLIDQLTGALPALLPVPAPGDTVQQ